MVELVLPDETIQYSYDANGNRTSRSSSRQKQGDKVKESKASNLETVTYLYDTENRLLAVKDKEGLLMAALYDGDDNRVFTANRKEGKHTYQLFAVKDKKKSPHTSPNGEEHSLFWYGFSQNVVQFFSNFGSHQGYDWVETFDVLSGAYHRKIAKDKANQDGLVVNPPDLGNLPGEGDVTYASQVQDVLIPYTTREDTFNYYEERNYVNDVNREHTEVLETYDRELKTKESYTYGQGRNSYLNHETGQQYHYLTNQAGSVTGLTKEGSPVASSSYAVYGATKASTDDTGNPYAYNGEARDETGLDYLRARYYDSQASTFLTEDSYRGELEEPLSQNGYTYVQNNPVNYTDPSGHRLRVASGVRSRKGRTYYSPSVNGNDFYDGPRAQYSAPPRQNYHYSDTPRNNGYARNYGQQSHTTRHPKPRNDRKRAGEQRQVLMGNGQKKTIRNKRKGGSFWDSDTQASQATRRHVCTVASKASDKGKKNQNQKQKAGLAILKTIAMLNYAAAGAFVLGFGNPKKKGVFSSIDQSFDIGDGEITGGNLFYTKYIKVSTKISKGGEGLINAQFTNGILSGVMTKNILGTTSLGFEGDRISLGISTNLFGLTQVADISIGRDGIGIFSGADDGKRNNGLGLHIGLDHQNGILDGYYSYGYSIQASDGTVTTQTTDSGFKTLNTPQALAIVGLARLLYGDSSVIQQIQQIQQIQPTPVIP